MPCTPAGKYRQDVTRRALGPLRAWQSLNSVAGACSPSYSVVGAALSLQMKNPTQTYDNHYVPRANQQSPRLPTPTGSGLGKSYPTRRPQGRDGTYPLAKTVAMAWPTTIYSHLTPDTACHDG